MRLLVIRTSAMGDVALMAPVIKAMRISFPSAEMTIVTSKAFLPFFPSDDKGLCFFTPDFRGRHKGIAGLIRLFFDLRLTGKFDHILDLHNVLRTKFLRGIYTASGVPVSSISKGRAEKRDLIKGRRKVRLKHTVERYADVFRSAGYMVDPFVGTAIEPEGTLPVWLTGDLRSALLKIGVAPFARHPLKTWPEDYMIKLLRKISSDINARFYVFGAPDEKERADIFCSEVPGSTVVSGRLDLGQELLLMRNLDLMIAMDSSNMHMAALTGTRVLSIWGATDPLAGFGAWMQPDNYAVRIAADDLTCRPCTVYGKGTCRRGDFACMNWLTPEKVFKMIEKLNILNPKIEK